MHLSVTTTIDDGTRINRLIPLDKISYIEIFQRDPVDGDEFSGEDNVVITMTEGSSITIDALSHKPKYQIATNTAETSAEMVELLERYL